MRCINPKSKFSAEKCETLGPKIQNFHNFNLRVVGGALREAIHPYENSPPNISILSDGTPKKERVVWICGNPRRALRFCRRERMTARRLCNGFFNTYALIPC
jgi:hypothetical protein